VVQSNLGVFTVDSSGGGAGIVTYPDYSLVSGVKAPNCGGPYTTCGAANPGDTLTIWGTGLGPVNGSDAAGVGLGVNMPNVPLTVWIGGVQAPVVFQGRGCCIGEDQIAFTVPNNVPTGCAVPLAVQINDQISNNTVIPVANGSRSCTPTETGLPANTEALVQAGPVTYGQVTLTRGSDGNGTFEDDAQAQFVNVTANDPGSQPFFLSEVDDTATGTCLVYNNLYQSSGPGPIVSLSPLDAGANITVKGSNGGTVQIPENQDFSTVSSNGAFLAPGTYTVTGPGGANVGPFSATFTIPAQPTLVSPVNNAAVTRANGMTVSWTGGSAGNVVLTVNGCTDSSCHNGAMAVCTVPASLGTFTIPAPVLLALPASPYGGFVFATQTEGSFTATGLQVGVLNVAHFNVAGFGYGWGSGGFTLK
jgi:hypothetical protein